MNSLTFTIATGAPPFEAELLGSGIPPAVYPAVGTYTILNVNNGVYTLQITDSNGCIFEQEITVDPNVTTTTTTVQPGNSIVIGNVQDPILIFNPTATNRSSAYIGYPDPAVVTLYLWFKTLDGQPLTSDTPFTYEIAGRNIIGGSIFSYNDVSDQIHMEVLEATSGPITTLTGDILLKTGFIESFFEYTYFKGAVDQLMQIDVTAPNNNIYTGINTKFTDGKAYGITTLNTGRIIMQFDDPA